jgi:hypothetical protein
VDRKTAFRVILALLGVFAGWTAASYAARALDSVKMCAQEAINSKDWSCLGVFVVTCYFRHLKVVFEKAGVDVTEANKREIDKTIHGIVGVEYKNCSATWKEVKKRLAADEDAFIAALKQALN